MKQLKKQAPRPPKVIKPCQLCGTLAGGRGNLTSGHSVRHTIRIDGVPRLLCYECKVYRKRRLCRNLTWEQLCEVRQAGETMLLPPRNEKDRVKACYLELVAEGIRPTLMAVSRRLDISGSTAGKWISVLIVDNEIPEIRSDEDMQSIALPPVQRIKDNCDTKVSDIKERIAFYASQVNTLKQPGPPTIFAAKKYQPERDRKGWQSPPDPLLPERFVGRPQAIVEPLHVIVAAYKTAWKRITTSPISMTPKKLKSHSRQHEEQIA